MGAVENREGTATLRRHRCSWQVGWLHCMSNHLMISLNLKLMKTENLGWFNSVCVTRQKHGTPSAVPVYPVVRKHFYDRSIPLYGTKPNSSSAISSQAFWSPSQRLLSRFNFFFTFKKIGSQMRATELASDRSSDDTNQRNTCPNITTVTARPLSSLIFLGVIDSWSFLFPYTTLSFF